MTRSVGRDRMLVTGRSRGWRAKAGGVLLALAMLAGQAQAAEPARWAAAWATANLAPEAKDQLAPSDYQDATLRQVVRLSAGGHQVRVRLSNAFGAEALKIRAAHIAVSTGPGSARIDPASDRALTFAGRPDVVIPKGADYWSDPVGLDVKALTSVAISLRYAEAPTAQTGHPGARATTYLLAGDHLAAPDLPGARTVERWHQIAAVEVLNSAKSAVLAAFGDSITDGYGVKADSNQRWTDFLAQRLEGRGMAVLNLGIGGNRVLADGLGPGGLARFERDVLSQPGVTHLLLLEGVNDLGVLTRQSPPASADAYLALGDQLIGAYRQMVERARGRGVKAIGATIPPFGGSGYYHATPQSEAARQALNAWIRTPGNFDAVVDWDATLRDPARPTHLAPAYDNDGLHPNIAGYEAMAKAIPLSLLAGRGRR